jgi:hypothetical protein
MHKHYALGRWNFAYRNPPKVKWYIIWHPRKKNTPAFSLWRFGVWRDTSKKSKR